MVTVVIGNNRDWSDRTDVLISPGSLLLAERQSVHELGCDALVIG